MNNINKHKDNNTINMVSGYMVIMSMHLYQQIIRWGGYGHWSHRLQPKCTKINHIKKSHSHNSLSMCYGHLSHCHTLRLVAPPSWPSLS